MRPDRRSVIRSRGQAVGLLLTGCFVAVGFPVEALRSSSDEVDPIVRIGFAALGLLLGGFIILRMARSGGHVRETGIRFLNPFGSRFLEWHVVDRFTLRPWGPFPRMAHASCSMAAPCTCGAPNPMFRPRNRSADRLVDALNEVLEATRNREPTGADGADHQSALWR